MWISKTWEWLVQEGIYRDLVSVGVVAFFGPVLAYRPWKNFRHTQRKIANNLDTSTPGGLTNVVNAIQNASASGSTGAAGDSGGS